ncbi:hypothetical protein B0H12DRAFT_1240094 [Mycena haematopus]|nr:hypothetical protein B0H12DRAFT_1240094 [Mycena haematopus]
MHTSFPPTLVRALPVPMPASRTRTPVLRPPYQHPHPHRITPLTLPNSASPPPLPHQSCLLLLRERAAAVTGPALPPSPQPATPILYNYILEIPTPPSVRPPAPSTASSTTAPRAAAHHALPIPLMGPLLTQNGSCRSTVGGRAWWSAASGGCWRWSRARGEVVVGGVRVLALAGAPEGEARAVPLVVAAPEVHGDEAGEDAVRVGDDGGGGG